LRDSAGIISLSERFREMTRTLSVLGVAHGDLQHGNILVTNGELRLIDYDGIFLPALTGMEASEFGHKNFQHPDRHNASFDGRLDRFSSIVIYTALVAVSADHSLWDRFNNDENLLFRAPDFTSNGSSELFRILLASSATSKLAEGLVAACQSRIEQVPTLEQVISGVVPIVTRPAHSAGTSHPPPPRHQPPPPTSTPQQPPMAGWQQPYRQPFVAAPPAEASRRLATAHKNCSANRLSIACSFDRLRYHRTAAQRGAPLGRPSARSILHSVYECQTGGCHQIAACGR
jgi:hypothetical protein